MLVKKSEISYTYIAVNKTPFFPGAGAFKGIFMSLVRADRAAAVYHTNFA